MRRRLWLAITPGPMRTRAVLMDDQGRSVLKARLPHGPCHPQALQRLSEALAMWCGGQVRVVLAVDGPEAFCITRRWFATFDHLTRRPLYAAIFPSGRSIINTKIASRRISSSPSLPTACT